MTGTGGSPRGLHQAGGHWIRLWPSSPAPCPAWLPLGRAATGQRGGGCLQPNADCCLPAAIFPVYRKTTSCFELRDMGDKPILVTPKNPLAGTRHHPEIPWALPGLCSSCSIPPTQPARNQHCLRPPDGMLAPSFSQSLFSALLPSSQCWLPAELQGRQEGCGCTSPPVLPSREPRWLHRPLQEPC